MIFFFFSFCILNQRKIFQSQNKNNRQKIQFNSIKKKKIPKRKSLSMYPIAKKKVNTTTTKLENTRRPCITIQQNNV